MRRLLLGAALLAATAPVQAQDAPRPRLKLDWLEPGGDEAPVTQPEEAAPTNTPASTSTPPPALIDTSDPAAIEASTGGRMGIAIVDSSGRMLLGFNRDERFAMCSTFKAPLAAAVLMGAEAGRFGMEGTLSFTQADVLDYAPVVKAGLPQGRLKIETLAKGAVEVSDNSAANLLLPLVGGPEGLTRFAKAHGDEVTRLDRTEPALNENAQGDERDTTSPAAMANLMARLLFRDMPAARATTLRGWLEGSTTGARRIRAGIPSDWKVGSKTGTCVDGNAVNDVAVLRAPSGREFVMAIYIDRPTVPTPKVEAAIAQAARAVLTELASRSPSGPRNEPETR